MIGNSIDLSLENIWKSWWAYRKGKKPSPELDEFQYHLEENLATLFEDLKNGNYEHGPYRSFTVSDNKRRAVSVASIRDRVVHRILYDYLVEVFDKTFIYDVWSCRDGKGLLACVKRTQKFLRSFPSAFVFRGDVRKFFDSVDKEILFQILKNKINDANTLNLLTKVIFSYPAGIPIGNLTSQIFANIYLNEFDTFVKNQIKPLAYLRYGDDFVIFDSNFDELKRKRIEDFLSEKLKLTLHPENQSLRSAKRGLHFLGLNFYPYEKCLNDRMRKRIFSRLNRQNYSSYWGLFNHHFPSKTDTLIHHLLSKDIL